MLTYMKLKYTALIGLLLIILGALLFNREFILKQVKVKKTSNKMETLMVQVENTRQVEASDVSQCRTVPFGSKPCGGPSGYLVYSAKTTDEKKLTTLLEEVTRLEREFNQVSGMASTCDIESPPRVKLDSVSGKCVSF